jgi:hypothetical protein
VDDVFGIHGLKSIQTSVGQLDGLVKVVFKPSEGRSFGVATRGGAWVCRAARIDELLCVRMLVDTDKWRNSHHAGGNALHALLTGAFSNEV